jgi:1-acyl-sn-glycerol-3-phosphate acyltransferase
LNELPPVAPVRAGTPLYWFTRGLTIFVMQLFTRPRFRGLEHIPKEGGVLVVSNHMSYADPVILMATFKRPLIFMAKEELWRKPKGARWFNAWGGAFPVRRGQNDFKAVRQAIELLRAGHAVVLFPEGTRHLEGLGRPQAGVGYLASRAGMPVLPIAINGTQRIHHIWDVRRFPPFTVTIGEPFTVDRRADPTEVAEEIMHRIAALLPPHRRGVYRETDAPDPMGDAGDHASVLSGVSSRLRTPPAGPPP